MIAMIKIELEKLFCSKRFYLCILGLIIGIQLNAWELMQYYLGYTTVCDLYTMGRTEGFALLSFILCVAGGGISFCIEQKGQSVHYITLRGNVRNYGIGKIVSAFVGGYLINFLGFALGELSLAISVYVKLGSWIGITSCIPQIGLDMVQLLVGSFKGSLLSVIALLVSVFIPDLFIALTIPIVIYYAWLAVTGWIQIPRFLDIVDVYSCFIGWDSISWSQFWSGIAYPFLFTLCMVYGLGCIIVKGMKWRVEHG